MSCFCLKLLFPQCCNERKSLVPRQQRFGAVAAAAAARCCRSVAELRANCEHEGTARPDPPVSLCDVPSEQQHRVAEIKNLFQKWHLSQGVLCPALSCHVALPYKGHLKGGGGEGAISPTCYLSLCVLFTAVLSLSWVS